MKCAWDAYLQILPMWMRGKVDLIGRETLQELRLRVGRCPELIGSDGSTVLERSVSEEDITYVINGASRYSPWNAETIREGYITAQGGHRIGICGEVATHENSVLTVRKPTSLSLRVARDFPGIAADAAELKGSVLIIGSPGTGKTTLLRDMIRQKSRVVSSSIGVVDQRKEIFPMEDGKFSFVPGARTDVLSGCEKRRGIEILLRVMGPQVIAVDEITAEADCKAIVKAGYCGVELLATAHARDRKELFSRPVYRSLLESGMFGNLIVLHPDKTWNAERMTQ